MASGGAQQTTRFHLSELEEMTEALSRAQQMARYRWVGFRSLNVMLPSVSVSVPLVFVG